MYTLLCKRVFTINITISECVVISKSINKCGRQLAVYRVSD